MSSNRSFSSSSSSQIPHKSNGLGNEATQRLPPTQEAAFWLPIFPQKGRRWPSGSMPKSFEFAVLLPALLIVFHEELIVHSMRRVGQLVFFESAPQEISLVGLAHIKCAIDKSINPVEGKFPQGRFQNGKGSRRVESPRNHTGTEP